MPTKTSPYNQPIPRMNTRPAQIIDTVNKMPGLATGAGAASAAGGLAKAIPGVNLALTAAKLIGTGVSEGKEAVEQGATKGQAVLKGALSSVGLGGIYEPEGIKERQASEKEFAEATANVNQELAKNIAAQKSSVTMKEEKEDMPPMTMAPLKQLSPYTASYSAYNMSAKQASMEPIMQKLSGASTLSPVNNLGMQSVKYGLDDNPEITAADPKAKFIAQNKNKND